MYNEDKLGGSIGIRALRYLFSRATGYTGCKQNGVGCFVWKKVFGVWNEYHMILHKWLLFVVKVTMLFLVMANLSEDQSSKSTFTCLGSLQSTESLVFDPD